MSARRLVIAALLVAAAGAAGALWMLWRSFRSGELLEAGAVAGQETLALFEFTARADDAGVIGALERIREMESRRSRAPLPPWARWLLAGTSSSGPSPQIAALLPVRIVGWVDQVGRDGPAAAAAISLSRYSEGISTALGADPAIRHRGVALARPASPGGPHAALAGNNIVLSASEGELRRAIDRLRGPGRPGALLSRALRLAAPPGDGFVALANPGDAVERALHAALARGGIELDPSSSPPRILPADLLGGGFSFDLLDADAARLDGALLYADGHAAEESLEEVRRGLPLALALLGVEARIEIVREDDVQRVRGTVHGLEGLWDRLLSGRIVPFRRAAHAMH